MSFPDYDPGIYGSVPPYPHGVRVKSIIFNLLRFNYEWAGCIVTSGEYFFPEGAASPLIKLYSEVKTWVIYNPFYLFVGSPLQFPTPRTNINIRAIYTDMYGSVLSSSGHNKPPL